MITQFDSSILKALRPEIEAALQAVAQKHGIKFSLGNAKYAATYFSLTVEGAIVKDGEVLTKESQTFVRFAETYGLQPEDLGRTFTTGGKTFTITGLSTGRTKRPVIAQCDGKTYVFPVETVNALLGRPPSRV